MSFVEYLNLNKTDKDADKTSYKFIGDEVVIKIWPSRSFMALAIRMQEKRATKSTDWKALIKLELNEGY